MAKFKLTSSYLYFWPITFQVPDPERSGKLITQTCELQFEAMSLDDFNTRMEERAKNPSINFGEDDASFIAEVTKDWREVQDDDGNDVPFSADSLRTAVQFPWFRNAALEAYQKSIASQGARKGN